MKESSMGVDCNYYLLPRPNTFRPTKDQLRQFIDLLRAAGWAPSGPLKGDARAEEGTMVDQTKKIRLSIGEGLGLISASGVPSQDLCFCWRFPNWDKTQACFPFVVEPEPEKGFISWYYDFEIHLMTAGYFAHDWAETIEPIEDSRCDCGEELDWVDFGVGMGPARTRALYKEFFGGYEGVGIAFSPIQALSRLRDHCPSCGRPFDPSKRAAKARDPMALAPYTIPGGITYRFAMMIDCGNSLPITLAPTNHLKAELVDLAQRHFGTKFYEVGAYG
jgi:hypothetical protein